MPVILRLAGYKFWFYEADLDEPAHVHAGREDRECKFWLNPVALARAGRFRPADLRFIEKIIREQRDFLLAAWAQEQAKRANRKS